MTLPSVPDPGRMARAAGVVLLCVLAAGAAAGPCRACMAPLGHAIRAAVASPILRSFEQAAGLLATTEAGLRRRRP